MLEQTGSSIRPQEAPSDWMWDAGQFKTKGMKERQSMEDKENPTRSKITACPGLALVGAALSHSQNCHLWHEIYGDRLMRRNPQSKEFNRAKYFWMGSGLVLMGTVFLVLSNYDDYHFFWLLGFLRVSIVFGFVMLSLSIIPSGLAEYLLRDRSSIGSLGLKTFLACFLWIGFFMVLGIAYQIGLKALDDSFCGCSAQVEGRVVAVDFTSSKGGSVEWAVYEFMVGGSLFKSAVRNKSLGLRPGQSVRVCYTSFWPRHNKVYTTLEKTSIHK